MIRNRLAPVLLCLALLIYVPAFAVAQESTATALGSDMARALIETLATETGTTVEFTVTGSSAGIDEFCNGEIDFVAASRPISGAEAAICASNEVTHSEFLLAHKIALFAAHADAPLDCLQTTDVEALFKPSAASQAADWSDFGASDSLAVTLLAPGSESDAYAILDSMVVGDGLRRDLVVFDDVAGGIDLIASTEGALALLPWSVDAAAASSVKLMQLGDSCAEASAANVEAKLYPAAQSLYLYVNRERLESNAALAGFIGSAISAESASLIEALGLAAPSPAMSEFNAQALQDPEVALAISDGDTDFTIPPNLAGAVTGAGAVNSYRLLQSVGARLSGSNPQFNLTLHGVGGAAGIDRLCSGEAQIAMLDSAAADIDLSDCGVSTSSIDLGAHAVILLGNEADAHTACLTAGQLDTVWNSASSGAVSHWNQVDAAMPDQAITLFAPLMLDRHADMLFVDHTVKPPIRRDTEQDYSPLYRAAATANVPGALTFMSWADYQSVLENDQVGIQLVGVDAGAGCVTPDLESILDGSYALSKPAHLLISEDALADIAMQSLLWQLFADESWPLIENNDFVGITQADLGAKRRDLETRFHLANARAAEIQAADAEADDASSDSDSG